MKKITLLLALAILSMTGCSKTWSGIKQDTHEVVENTRDAIHEATSPVQTPTATAEAVVSTTEAETVSAQPAVITNPVVQTTETIN